MHSRRQAVRAACVLLAAFVIASARAEPRWAIARPVPEGKLSPLAATPLQKRVAEEKELDEKYPVYIEHIEVQGFRPRDPFAPPPRTKEQQFAGLYKAADQALYQAKAAGRSGYAAFQPSEN